MKTTICAVCGKTKEEEALTIYFSKDLSCTVYLCRTCRVRLKKKTNGVIPFDALADMKEILLDVGGGEDGGGGTEKDNRRYPQEFLDLGRSFSLILGLLY